MSESMRALLEETGFEADRIQRYQRLEDQGRTEDCIRLLMLRRTELVDALHEAQRPIDAIDWAIRSLERQA